jgi:hypothetical protein
VWLERLLQKQRLCVPAGSRAISDCLPLASARRDRYGFGWHIKRVFWSLPYAVHRDVGWRSNRGPIHLGPRAGIYDDERDDAPVRQLARRFGMFREAWTAGSAALEKIRARRRCWVLRVERPRRPPRRRLVRDHGCRSPHLPPRRSGRPWRRDHAGRIPGPVPIHRLSPRQEALLVLVQSPAGGQGGSARDPIVGSMQCSGPCAPSLSRDQRHAGHKQAAQRRLLHRGRPAHGAGKVPEDRILTLIAAMAASINSFAGSPDRRHSAGTL